MSSDLSHVPLVRVSSTTPSRHPSGLRRLADEKENAPAARRSHPHTKTLGTVDVYKDQTTALWLLRPTCRVCVGVCRPGRGDGHRGRRGKGCRRDCRRTRVSVLFPPPVPHRIITLVPRTPRATPDLFPCHLSRHGHPGLFASKFRTEVVKDHKPSTK